MAGVEIQANATLEGRAIMSSSQNSTQGFIHYYFLVAGTRSLLARPERALTQLSTQLAFQFSGQKYQLFQLRLRSVEFLPTLLLSFFFDYSWAVSLSVARAAVKGKKTSLTAHLGANGPSPVEIISQDWDILKTCFISVVIG